MKPAKATTAHERYLAVWRSTHVFESTYCHLLDEQWDTLVLGDHPRYSRRPRAARIGRPWPFATASFQAAFLMHVLEHHTEAQLRRLAAEVFRVMKPGGVVRISTPDLECEARHYLDRLERAKNSANELDRLTLDLARMRMIDQIVRTRVGGDMLSAMEAGGARRSDVRETFGAALDYLGDGGKFDHPAGWRRRYLADLPFAVWRKVLMVAIGHRHPYITGELDRTKPDFFMLQGLLEAAGFVNVERREPGESSIGGWDRWDFDRTKSGDEIEPGLYLEALRP